MSVTETITLPAQPTVGNTTFLPLGGNGFTSPHSMYTVAMAIDGDASGGIIQAKVNLDPRYAALISVMQGQSDSAVQADDYRFAIEAKGGVFFLSNVGTMKYSAWEAYNRITWNPSGLMDPDSASFQCVNVDATETYSFSFIVYNFDINAPQQIALPQLFSVLPRASSAI